MCFRDPSSEDQSEKGSVLSEEEIEEFFLGPLSEIKRNNRKVTIVEDILMASYNSSSGISAKTRVRLTLGDQDVQEFLVGSCANRINSQATSLENALSGPYNKVWEIAKDQAKIDYGRVLGSGEFCRVYKAVLTWFGRDIEVAVKVPKKNCTSIVLKDLLSELKIMTYLGSHPNIVGLIGAYTGELWEGNVHIAMELCSFGSLESYLRKHQCEEKYYADFENIDIDENNNEVAGCMETKFGLPGTKPLLQSMKCEWIATLSQWSHEIACGMEYLERKGVVHADLATRNIFLTSERTAKITNFGLTKKLRNYSDYMDTEPESLPWQWMAIESFENFEISSNSDVWSYGVTMWEIFSNGRTPYPELIWSDDFVDELSNGLRPDSPLFASPEIFELMEACWVADPEKRPSFNDLMKYTGSILQNIRNQNC